MIQINTNHGHGFFGENLNRTHPETMAFDHDLLVFSHVFPSDFPLSTNPKLQNLTVIPASRRNSASPASSGQFTAAAKTCGPDGYPVNIKITQNSWDGSGCFVRNDICRY